MKENLEKAYQFFISETGEMMSKEKFKRLVSRYMSLEEISENDLKNVACGLKSESFTSSFLVALSMISPAVTVEDINCRWVVGSNENINRIVHHEEKNYIVKYFTEPKISEAQLKVFNIISKFLQGEFSEWEHVSTLSAISSYRCPGVSREDPTEVEQILDRAVKENDLPIYSFTLEEIRGAKEKYTPDTKAHPEYIIDIGNDVLNLHKIASDGAIVQVASRYNALESVDSNFSPVKEWFCDKTQGQMASLQAVSATKHRESAALQGRVPDAIQRLLDGCMVTTAKFFGAIKTKTKITHKYPKLYENGYFSPTIIEKENLSDLKYLSDYIKQNKSKLGFNSQWVKCEGSDKKQLQVFSAAPSFQGTSSWLNWESIDDSRIPIYKEICKDLVVEQYRAIAHVAAIKAAESGRQEELHLYQVGQGAFYNTFETMPLALKSVQRELEGFNVKVILHQSCNGRERHWKDIMSNI